MTIIMWGICPTLFILNFCMYIIIMRREICKITYHFFKITRYGGVNMTLEEAKNLMTDASLEKLQGLTSVTQQELKISEKINMDILMSSLCKAVTSDIIKKTSLDNKLVKILGSPTNTLQENKFDDIIRSLRKKQPSLCCDITIYSKNMSDKINTWRFTGNKLIDPTFNDIFEYVIDRFSITPPMVRKKLGSVLKSTIVNNVAQLVAKYMCSDENERKYIRISINTISRLINMEEHMIFAEFKEE